MESNLGNALTALGLEDKFLSNGDLSNFSLVERGKIANGIIAEKLRLGRWQSVVQMMYGGFGKADALYEGDRDELREGIVKSATEHPSFLSFQQETLEALSKAGENDLLFRLATNAPNLNCDEFNSAVSKINSSYFDDVEAGNQRRQTMHQTIANKAMKDQTYREAFYHFAKANNKEGIGEVFETVLAINSNYFSGELLEKIALSDPEQRDERLKRIVLSPISEQGGALNPLAACELSNKHNILLSIEEKTALKERVAESASRYDIEKKLFGDSEVRLLWAKKHAKDEPQTAYEIFTEQEFDGTEVMMAVKAGLSVERYRNEARLLEISDVSEPHLRSAYESAAFSVQVQIASHLRDSEKLQGLSKQAHEKDDLDKAYSLWVSGGGNLDVDYINGIRTAIIENCVENNFGYMTFLDDSDVKGMTEAYNTLMETDKGKRTDNLRHAYEIVLKLEDEDRTQRAREEMVAINPNWAIRNFTNRTGVNDEKGLDYALGVVASEHGVEKEELKHFVKQYQTE